MKTKMNVYCMYDETAEEAWPLFESVNDGTAFRAYQTECQNKKFPTDEIKLYWIGEFDRDNMTMVVGEVREVKEKLSLVDQMEVDNA